MIQSRVKALLLEFKEKLQAEDPNLALFLTVAEKNLNPPILKTTLEKLKQGLQPIEIISIDGKEKIGFAEQIIIYDLYKHAEARQSKLSLDPPKLFELVCRLGSYEALCFQCSVLLNKIKRSPTSSKDSIAASAEIAETNSRLIHLYWGAGYFEAAINQLTEISFLADKARAGEGDDVLFAKIQSMQETALRNLLCTISLKDSEMSNKIMASVIIKGDLLSRFQESELRNTFIETDESQDVLNALVNSLQTCLSIEVYERVRLEAINEVNGIIDRGVG